MNLYENRATLEARDRMNYLKWAIAEERNALEDQQLQVKNQIKKMLLALPLHPTDVDLAPLQAAAQEALALNEKLAGFDYILNLANGGNQPYFLILQRTDNS